MRKRRHQRDLAVFILSFLGSAALNALFAVPMRSLMETYLFGPGRERPVRVVRLSPEQWDRNRLGQDGRVPVAPRPPSSAANKPPPATADKAKAQEKQPEKEKPKPEDKVTGQVVEVPPTPDESPNPDAKYLSKYNTHVAKETVARPDERDPRMKRVTNKLQTLEQKKAEQAIATPNLSLKGDGVPEDAEGTTGAAKGDKQKFVLEVPDLARREHVELKLSDGPGIGQHVANRTGSEAMKGNSNNFQLQLGSGTEDQGGEGGGGKKGSTTGADTPKPLPTLSALMPTVGAVSSLSGSPSRDHVEGLPEGEGTFLNTKEFKYATFFYRVRDSVAGFWEDLAATEYRRRDPTGNIYGVRDRSTLLQVRLSRDGHLSDVRVEQTSGVDFLDHVAVEAFKKAEPFPNPPAGIADEDGSIRFNFQFVVTMRSRSPINLFQYR